MIMIIYVSIYLYMSLFDMVVKDHSCGGMIAYAEELHEEVLCLTRNQLGRIVITNI